LQESVDVLLCRAGDEDGCEGLLQFGNQAVEVLLRHRSKKSVGSLPAADQFADEGSQ
jgi:hypothetical protein